MLTLEEGKGSLVHCQQPFPIAAMRLIIVIFRLNVTVEDFVLVHDAVDVSQLLGLSGELKHDLELQQVGGCQLHGQRGEGRGGQVVQVQLLKNESGGL